MENYPVPSIFLYRREADGYPVYDVLDGKQRLETIFMFSRTRHFSRHGFDVRFRLDGDDSPRRYAWRDLKRGRRTASYLSYKIPTVEVSGNLSDIIDLFVRINSTGKALSSSEKRHAKYYNGEFLRHAQRLARRFQRYLVQQQIIGDQQITRMKDVELVSELLAALAAGQPLHAKAAVDRAISNEALHGQTLRRVIAEFVATMRLTKRLIPELRTTRFHNMSEFYSLFLVVAEFRAQKVILTDRKRNQLAADLLRHFSNEVDAAHERQRAAKGVPAGKQLYVDYLLSMQRGTDHLGQRQRRAQLIKGLLGGLFERKDERRIFSSEQRRLLWNSDEKKRCSECACVLDWTNFQADHVKAHSRGGRTSLGNAALICRHCNPSKGSRRRARRTAG